MSFTLRFRLYHLRNRYIFLLLSTTNHCVLVGFELVTPYSFVCHRLESVLQPRPHVFQF
jgi:hypothetical protein